MYLHVYVCVCMNILPAFVYVHHMHVVPMEARRRHQIRLGLKLQVVVRHRLGAENVSGSSAKAASVLNC